MTVDVEALLASASLPTAQYALCLNADLHQRWEDAEVAVRVAKGELERRRKTGEPPAAAVKAVSDAQEKADALRGEVDANTLRLTFRALKAAAFEGLRIKHPPRKGVDTDRAQGIDPTTFYPALIAACTVEPSITADQWDRLFDAMTDRQMTDMASAVARINQVETTTVPFLSSASGTTTA